MTIAEASSAIRARTLSPVELTQSFLNRIKALDGQLDAYLMVLEETALAAAKQAEQEIAAGRWKGPLHGIPIGLKDIYNTAGVRTTGHSALFRITSHRRCRHRHAAARGRAIVLGKLATWEFAIGGASFDLPWPPARNPWNTAHDPGGSSSGSGAAVAAVWRWRRWDDTGGSIRGPRPGAHRRPQANLWLSQPPRHSAVVFIARSRRADVLDGGGLRVMMNVLARHDPWTRPAPRSPCPISRHLSAADWPASASRCRAIFRVRSDLRARGSVSLQRRAGRVPLPRRHGHRHHPPSTGLYHRSRLLITAAEAFAIHGNWLRETPELYGERGRLRIMVGAFVSGETLVQRAPRTARLSAIIASALTTPIC